MEDMRMNQIFGGSLNTLFMARHEKSRAINAENPTGEKGRGGMAASHLGPSRKGSPCLRDIKSGETVTLAEIQGPGMIHHIWITVTDKTTEADCFVLRDLVLRIRPGVYCKFHSDCGSAKPGAELLFPDAVPEKGKDHPGKPACQ